MENLEVPNPDGCLATPYLLLLANYDEFSVTQGSIVPQGYASCSDVAAPENLIGRHCDDSISGRSTVVVNWHLSITGVTVGPGGGSLSTSFLTFKSIDINKQEAFTKI